MGLRTIIINLTDQKIPWKTRNIWWPRPESELSLIAFSPAVINGPKETGINVSLMCRRELSQRRCSLLLDVHKKVCFMQYLNPGEPGPRELSLGRFQHPACCVSTGVGPAWTRGGLHTWSALDWLADGPTGGGLRAKRGAVYVSVRCAARSDSADVPSVRLRK